LLEKLVSLSEENLKLVQVRFKEGDAAKLDLQLSELELNRWKIQMLQAELQVKANLTQIRFLVGLETSFPLKLKNYNPVFELKQDILELQNLALENRLDLQVARINEDIAQATVNLTKSRAKNDIELFARYQEERKTENNVLGNFSNIERKIGGGISFTLPFYNRGQGNIAESIANKTQTTYLREQLEQRIKQDVTLALAQFINAQESLKLFEVYILPKAESNLKILQVAYQLGEQDLTDVISEQRKFIESQKEYLNAQREYSLSLIALERAVGKSLN
jgi:cobalt-zinc-cadmium efflux system outer membrane protein